MKKIILLAAIFSANQLICKKPENTTVKPQKSTFFQKLTGLGCLAGAIYCGIQAKKAFSGSELANYKLLRESAALWKIGEFFGVVDASPKAIAETILSSKKDVNFLGWAASTLGLAIAGTTLILKA